MGRVVGATLIVLGLFIIVAVIREGRDFHMRSRWMLVIIALRRATRVFVPRSRRAVPEAFVIEHDHEHEHDRPHAHPDEHLAPAMAAVALHEHSHAAVPATVPSGAGSTGPDSAGPGHRHKHRHRHVVDLPADPLPTYGAFSAVGIGMLHGVGAETPTQLVIFAGAAGVAGIWSGLLVLSAFLVGLLAANTAVAAAAAFGFVGATRRVRLYLALSVVAAVCSLAIGTLFVLNRADVLPVILSG
jgi:hypothetical protein